MNLRTGLLLGLVLVASRCERGSGVSPCAEVICADWQQCSGGECVAAEGRCDSYVDCAADEECGADHRCVGPTRPPEGYPEPLAGPGVTFEYRGLINSYEDLSAGTLTDGLSTWQVHASGGTTSFTESAYTYGRTTPADYFEAELADRDVVFFGVSRVLESSAAGSHYRHLAGGVAVDALVDMMEADTPEAPAPAAFVLKLWDVHQTVRSWDRAVFRRYCLLAEREPVAGESLFLSYLHNDRFAPGEDLQLWGRLGLTEPVEITPALEDQRCAWDVNGVPVSQQEYEDGLAVTSPELPCDTPPGLMDAVATESATFVFLGRLNDLAEGFANFELGLGTLTLASSNGPLVADDQYLLAYRYTSPPSTDWLVVQTLGSVEQPAVDRYQYLVFRLITVRAALLAMVSGGASSLAFDPQLMEATVEWVDNKERGSGSWYKVCPRLVSDPAATAGALAACYDPSTQFVADEELQLAGSLAMTSDASAITAVYGTSTECHCYLNLTTNPVDCADFDAQ